jgi:hypothetical protein
LYAKRLMFCCFVFFLLLLCYKRGETVFMEIFPGASGDVQRELRRKESTFFCCYLRFRPS